MKISILCDNQSLNNHFSCEHGFSAYVEINGCRILFDTGQSDCFIKNANLLGIRLEETDYVILSHGHYDHTGGLDKLMSRFPHLRIAMHPSATKRRFSTSSVMTKENGFPHKPLASKWEDQTTLVRQWHELLPGVIVFPLPFAAPENERLKEHSPTGELVADTFLDELFIVLKEADKHVLLSGCTHHGIVQVLDYCTTEHFIHHFHLVLGGLHLAGTDETAIKKQIAQCATFDIEKFALNHCTGQLAFDLWSEAFKHKVITAKAGETITI